MPCSKKKVKVKVVPYTLLRRGVFVGEDTYPEPSACEVGWPVPFLAAFIQLYSHAVIQLNLQWESSMDNLRKHRCGPLSQRPSSQHADIQSRLIIFRSVVPGRATEREASGQIAPGPQGPRNFRTPNASRSGEPH